ncbi:hypothetical protein [Burkholderia territorii]|uniref:Uncharacterized protein n=1 Tax=Burkholderia territorii TaxID=1503055 RepID=A0A6L3NN44_9BURK|nr:hypothetical protein [Burkholderia territorii]KAB0686230.1 hypothetical protein F7R13_01415 [Burkholderia territorii]MBM2773441.1 hypothetical protein [Burkholderia territorii]
MGTDYRISVSSAFALAIAASTDSRISIRRSIYRVVTIRTSAAAAAILKSTAQNLTCQMEI